MTVQSPIVFPESNLISKFFVSCVFIFSLEYALYLVSGVFLDGIIKLSSLAFLMLFVVKPNNRIGTNELALLLLYCMLFLTAILPSIFSADLTGGGTVVKLFYMFLILPVLLICYRSIPKCDNLLISAFIGIGAFFSVQAIVASIGVYVGAFDRSNITQIQRYGNMDIVSFGFWGFGNAIQTPIADFKVLRPQGWFIEPSKLASFLLLPGFVSIGRYRISGGGIYKFSAMVIFMAIFLTLSLAGYFAVICSILLLLFSKIIYRYLKNIPVLRFGYIIIIFLVFFGFAYGLLNLAYIANDIDKKTVTEGQAVVADLFSRDKDGSSGNLFRETYKSDNYVELLMHSPFGLGFGSKSVSSEFRSGNALLFWFTAGGIPALVVIVLLFGYIFSVFCHPLLISENRVFNALGASFIGHAITNLSYGTWIAPHFLIHLALVVMSARKAKLSVDRSG